MFYRLRGDLVLNPRKLRSLTLKALTPNAVVIGCINEFDSDADGVASGADAPRQDRTHTKLMSYCARIGALTLVAKAGIARHHPQFAESGQRVNHGFTESVAKIFRIGTVANIVER